MACTWAAVGYTQVYLGVPVTDTWLGTKGFCWLDDPAMGGSVDASGAPLVNKSKFPDVKAMVAYGHSKEVSMGWYNNNCICMDGPAKASDSAWGAKCFAADVQFLVDNDFDAVKVSCFC